MMETRSQPPSRVLLVIVAVIAWVVDQVTKTLVVQNLALGETFAPIPALARFFTFTHTTNTGAAFGLFPDAGWIFVIVAIIVISAILFYYRHLPTEHLLVRVSLGLQLGGALGNLTDRLVRGSVVDFLDFKIWPVFNVADSCIVVGVAILAFYLMREETVGSAPQSLAASPSGDGDRGPQP